jgi:hypothetical protein
VSPGNRQERLDIWRTRDIYYNYKDIRRAPTLAGFEGTLVPWWAAVRTLQPLKDIRIPLNDEPLKVSKCLYGMAVKQQYVLVWLRMVMCM